MKLWQIYVKNMHCSVEHIPPQLISQGWEVGTGETLYSKRGSNPTRPPSPAPSRRGRPAQYPFVTEQMEGQCFAKFRLWQLAN